MIGYISLNQLYEDGYEYDTRYEVDVHNVEYPYVTVAINNPRPKEGKSGSINVRYHGVDIYHRDFGTIHNDGVEDYTLPDTLCCEDMRNIHDAVDLFYTKPRIPEVVAEKLSTFDIKKNVSN